MTAMPGPVLATAVRWRAVTPVAKVKCGEDSARDLVALLGGHVERSTVSVLAGGYLLLARWESAP